LSAYPTAASAARCAVRGCRCGIRRPVYPSDMSDAEWEVLEPEAVQVMAQIRLAPGRPMDHPLRPMVDGVRYVVRNGIEWRAMPVDFRRGRRCTRSGIAGAHEGCRTISDLGRPLPDVDHVQDPVAALPHLPALAAQPTPGTQAPSKVTSQPATGRHIQRLVDRLHRDPHPRVVTELAAQPAHNLLRRILLAQILLDPLAQPRVGQQLARFGVAGPRIGQRARSWAGTDRHDPCCATAPG